MRVLQIDIQGRTVMDDKTNQSEQGQETKIPNDGFIFTTVFFNFVGEQDRNVLTNWPGEIPRKGEFVTLKGRDANWIVTKVEWMFDIDKAKQRFDRAAMIEMEKVT